MRGAEMNKSDALARREAERDAVLQSLASQVPYNRFLGVVFDRLGDELTARLPYKEPLIGNPFLPAIHGGVTGAFLEITALTQLAWDAAWAIMEKGGDAADLLFSGTFPPVPKTIDITIDYLRSGRPRLKLSPEPMFRRSDGASLTSRSRHGRTTATGPSRYCEATF